jgi:ubiquinone/menaquinone biosynthesis C-methylase UbiE
MSKTSQSRKAYNKKANDYDNTMDGRFTRPLKQLMLNTISIVAGQRVLDVACGTGDLIASLAKRADNVHAYGIDIAEQMIEVARAAHPSTSYTVSPSVPLPFDNSTMDVITVSAAFHHFEEPQRFANECMRVISGDGRLYIGEFSYSTVERFILNPLLPLLRSGDVKLYSEKELASFFVKAGFETTGIERAGKCIVLSLKKEID